ncbi:MULTISPECIES: PH domain-containing protein [unclassified Xanthomonas]|uniref:PH domain-containing protein n=1 Tax=unclassified Xanthomonas TaxID=2643310 RepID=UPI002B22C4D3|nr:MULTISPECIES: PH domain-containing protein [unclassified Xanthomonas]MEA9566049.1 PH domain-containing protein [Xanthomonas sp. WHRI 8932A]MEA9635396.1 PH domain-containing protein [Xanthomonas sp. WHRI 8812E]
MNAIEHPGHDEQRLHPLSWVFVLLQQIRQFLIPLVALVVFGSRDGSRDFADHIATAVVISVLVAISVLRYFTYRYRIGQDSVAIRSGLLERSRRDIPFARIHNVVVHQSLLHRLAGVAEVRLESAGGHKPEAEMRVLRLDQALALEDLIRRRAHHADAAAAAVQTDDRTTLLRLPMGEVIRLGLISNRGMVVVAASFGVIYQMIPRRVASSFIETNGEIAYRYVNQIHPGAAVTTILVTIAVVAVLLAMRALSVALAVAQYHGFHLSESERRLTVERGLLTRIRSSVALRRIQSWTVYESRLHRLFGRRQLRVDTAVTNTGDNHDSALKELAPIAEPQRCDALLQSLLPGIAWPPAQWQAIATHCWWRLSLPMLLMLLPLVAGLAWQFGSQAAWLLLWLPWSAFKAHRQVHRMGYAVDARYVAVRGGWWKRWWRLAELDKLQALQLQRSPLDRLTGTSTLWLDTAGASPTGPALRLRFVPLAQAQALQTQLGAALARRKLRW